MPDVLGMLQLAVDPVTSTQERRAELGNELLGSIGLPAEMADQPLSGAAIGGSFIGLLKGLFGVGGAFLIVPVMSRFGRVRREVAVGSSLFAILVASLVAALLCARRGIVAPTTGCMSPDPACRVQVVQQPVPLERPLVLVNSFASGGTHYSVVVRT